MKQTKLSVLVCCSYSLLTRYLSLDTLTKKMSSPARTFSPSDLCLDAGWTVNQQLSFTQPRDREREKEMAHSDLLGKRTEGSVDKTPSRDTP